MGKLSVSMALAIMMVTGSIWATAPKDKTDEQTLSRQIQEILSENSIYVKSEDLTARVLFTLNEDQRIVVLAVKSEHWDVKSFLNRRLDKKKVSIADFEVGKQYVVDVRLTS